MPLEFLVNICLFFLDFWYLHCGYCSLQSYNRNYSDTFNLLFLRHTYTLLIVLTGSCWYSWYGIEYWLCTITAVNFPRLFWIEHFLNHCFRRTSCRSWYQEWNEGHNINELVQSITLVHLWCDISGRVELYSKDATPQQFESDCTRVAGFYHHSIGNFCSLVRP